MKQSNWKSSLIAGVVLGILTILLQPTGYIPQTKNVFAANSAEKVLLKALQSHTQWSSLDGEATLVQYDADGVAHTDVILISVAQPLQAKISYKTTNDPEKTKKEWVSDGKMVYLIDKSNLSFVESPIPPFAKKVDFLPQNLTDLKPGEVYHHPFEMAISNPIMEYIYPGWFAQAPSGSRYQLLGEDEIAGRTTWKLNLQTATDNVTAWIDQKTGIILKYEQESNGQKIVEMEMTSINFEKQFAPQDFSAPDKDKYKNSDTP